MLSKAAKMVTAAVSIALAVTACDLSRTEKTGGVSEEPHPRAKADEYKRNPSPKQRYDITMTIADAPGPFRFVEGFAQYEAPGCVFTLNSIAGVHSIPKYRMPISYRKLDSGTYIGTVYLDAMLNEDYLGKGICHWEFTGTTVILKATAADVETGFAPSLEDKQVLAQKSSILYFMKQFYPRDKKIDDYSEFGQADRTRFPPHVTDGDIFTVTLVSKEVQP